MFYIIHIPSSKHYFKSRISGHGVTREVSPTFKLGIPCGEISRISGHGTDLLPGLWPVLIKFNYIKHTTEYTNMKTALKLSDNWFYTYSLS